MIEPEDLPPDVIAAAGELVAAIDLSGVLGAAGQPDLEVRARAVATVAVAMHRTQVMLVFEDYEP